MKKKIYIHQKFIFILTLGAVLCGNPFSVFSQCDPTTPSFVVDLSSNADSVWSVNNIARLDSCCFQQGSDPCIEFIVTLAPGVGGLHFSVKSPAPSVSSSQYHINCDTATYSVLKDTVCISNYTPPYIITYCKPGADKPTYTIEGIGEGNVSGPITVSNACFDTIFGTGFKESTITWTSYPYDPLYQSFLSDTVAQDTVVVTPSGTYPDSLKYVICGQLAGFNCSNGTSTKCDTTTVYFVSTFNVAIAPQNPTICFGGTPAALTANATGGAAPYSYLWNTGATTQSINVSSGNAGLYWVEVKDTLKCAGVIDSVTVTEFTSSIAADAGTDLISCNNNPPVTLNGSVQAASGGIWTGGAGTFSPNDTTLNAIYTPASSEITAGSATLFLTTTGNGSCPADTDTVNIAITPNPVVGAGSDQTVCADNGGVILSGSVSGGAVTGQWTTSGNGNFSPNDSTLSASYNPSSSDISTGVVTLYLTSTNNGQCFSVKDSLLLNIIDSIKVNAGTDQIVCANNNVVTLSGSVSGPTTTGQWTTNGTGNFSPNDSDFTATYTPSSADTSAGTVAIILTSTSNGICSPRKDTMVVTITSIPLIDAGADQTVCKNNSATQLGGNISGGTITGQWTTSGSGNFSPNDSDLTAIYNPGSADTSAGSITIILTSTDNGGCNAVKDSMHINFSNSPTSYAGTDQTICADAASVSLNGTVTISTGGIWTTGGTGNFSPNDSSLTTNYIPTAADTAAGSVTITLTTTGNSTCNAVSDSMLITITDAPTVDAGPNQTVCANNAGLSLNGSVTIATGGIWTTNGTGNFSPNDSLLTATYNPSSSDTAAGTVTLTLTTTGNGSCNAASDSLQITITPAPVADAGADIFVCKTNPDATLNGNVSVASGGTWTTSGSGNFSPNANTLNATYIPNATDVSSGSVTLTLTTTGNGTCIAVSDTVKITYTTDSISVNAGNDTTVCSASFPLNGAVYIATGGIWTTNGTGTFSPNDSTLNATYAFSNADTTTGTVTFFLTTTGNGGCASKNDTMIVSIAASISVNASASDSVCGNGDPIPVSAVSSTLTGIWTTLGDGNFSPNDTALNTSYIPGSADISNGNATLIFASSNNNGCAAVTDTLTIGLVPAPFTNFTADSVCLNNATTFTDATTTVGTIVSWNWNFGDGGSATLTSPSHTYSSDGNYTVTLVTSSNYGCVDTMTKSVIVYAVPNANFASASQCFVDSAFFNDLSTISSGNITQWQWDFGDSGSATLTNPSHLYASAGTYTISMIVFSNFGCSDTASKTVSIQPAPTVNFGHTTGCSGQTIFFFDSTTISSGNIISLQWNFGDGGSSALTNPSHTYSANGIYNVQLIAVSDSGCSDTIVKQVFVFAVPVAAFASTAQCFVDSVFFTDNSTISNGSINQWHWNFGDGDSATLTNPSHFYNSAGIYNITLIVTSSNGCSDTISQSLSVNPMPGADFGSTTGCLGIATAFLDSTTISSGNVVSWNWDFGDGGSATVSSPSHTYSSEGTYNVQLIAVSDSGCSDTIVKQITVYPAPVAAFASTAQCFVDSVYFTDSSSISSGNITQWHWNFGDGDSATLTNPSHFYNGAGSYTVSLIVVSSFGCTDTLTQTLNIHPAPDAEFTATNNCLGLPEIFTDSSSILFGNIVSWNWDFGDSTTSNLQNPSHVYPVNDTFSVQLTVTSDFGCTDTTTEQVIVYPSPNAAFSDSGHCQSDGIAFINSSSALPDSIVSWHWYFGDGGQSIIQNPLYVYNTLGNYPATLIVTTNHGCADTVTNVVDVSPSPVAAFSADRHVVYTGDAINFTDLSTGATGWHWDFGDSLGLTSIDQNPTYIYKRGGTFIVTFTVANSFGCEDIAYDTIIVELPPRVPNGFSPNGDGKNDILYPMGGPYKTLEFKIYNNWGELIFISRNSADGWDGRREGIPQPMGVYVYTLNAITEDDNEYSLHGDVTLLR